MASEPVYGTGRPRTEGKRRGYGKQGPQRATTDKVGADSDRRKKALATMMESSRARTAQTMATTAQTSSAIAGSQSAMANASSMLANAGSPAALGALREAAKGGVSGAPITGNGRVARLARRIDGAQGIKGLANRIERQGYTVGELEGFGGTGQVTGGHTSGSEHYDGRAMDITGPKLKVLMKALAKAYGQGPGSITPGAYGGHEGHIHAGFEGRRDLRLDELIHDPVGSYFN